MTVNRRAAAISGAALVVTMSLAACGTKSAAPATSTTTTLAVALGANNDSGPATPDKVPLQGQLLAPGETYLLADAFGHVGVRFSGHATPAYIGMAPGAVTMTPMPDSSRNIMSVWSTAGLRIATDPFVNPEQLASPADLDRALSPAPSDLLAWLAATGFVQVVDPRHPVTVGGFQGEEVAFRILPMPPEAKPNSSCRDGCVILWAGNGALYALEPRPELWHVALVDVAGQQVLVESYEQPAAAELLTSLEFVVSSPSSSSS